MNNCRFENLFLKKLLWFFLLAFSSIALAEKDEISGEYTAKNRYAQFEKLKNGDVKFYISGIGIGSPYSCNIGDENFDDGDPTQKKLLVLKMNGVTGGFTNTNNSISVEFGKNSARVIVGKSQCIIDGMYKKIKGKKSVDWSGGGD
jgi:hypothetical protein